MSTLRAFLILLPLLLPEHLVLLRPVAHSIAAHVTHSYSIDLNAEDRAEITVMEGGELDIATYLPDGKLLEKLQPAGSDGEQDFVISGKVPGTYRIDVTSRGSRPAVYEIVLDDISPPGQRSQQDAIDIESRDQQVTDDDLRLLERADAILSSISVWNRKDTRICLPEEKKRSLFCALEKAQLDLFDEYHHRAVALQEVRFAIEDVTGGREFEHRLRDYNNLPSTQFPDVKRVLTIATHRVRIRFAAQRKPAQDLQVIKRVRELLGAPAAWNPATTFEDIRKLLQFVEDRLVKRSTP